VGKKVGNRLTELQRRFQSEDVKGQTWGGKTTRVQTRWTRGGFVVCRKIFATEERKKKKAYSQGRCAGFGHIEELDDTFRHKSGRGAEKRREVIVLVANAMEGKSWGPWLSGEKKKEKSAAVRGCDDQGVGKKDCGVELEKFATTKGGKEKKEITRGQCFRSMGEQ